MSDYKLGTTKLTDIEQYTRAAAKAVQHANPYLPLAHVEVKHSLMAVLPSHFALQYRCFPIDRIGSLMTIATEKKLDIADLYEIQRVSGCNVLCFSSTPREIDHAIRKHYGREIGEDAHHDESGGMPYPHPDRLMRDGRESMDGEQAEDMIRIAETAQRLNIPLLDLNGFRPIAKCVNVLPRHVAVRYQVLAIAESHGALTLAMVDPNNILAIDDIQLITGLHVFPVICTQKDFHRRFDAFYTLPMAMTSLLGNGAASGVKLETVREASEEINIDELIEKSGSPSVIEVVNFMLAHATMTQASDIHIEPFKKRLGLRFRIDGVLNEMTPPPRQMYHAIVSRIKIMSDLNISERRLPQDGRFRVQINGREVDFRVSCLPTAHGEKVVIRVLDQIVLEDLTLDTLGFDRQELGAFRSAIGAPHGMIIMTGPTSSGKSSTLYMVLKELNKPGVNIVTVVDPIEYEIEGVNQVAVKPAIGLSFATGLRSILRQDPNIIMIGEIRDCETADIAIKAALTGHLVLCTLHTNDAASSIIRLIDMGVEDYLISSSLLLVAAQRLLRRNCRKCTREFTMTQEQLRAIKGLTIDGGKAPVLYRGDGCPECRNTGYSGRLAIIETITVDDDIRRLISRKTPAADIKRAAI